MDEWGKSRAEAIRTGRYMTATIDSLQKRSRGMIETVTPKRVTRLSLNVEDVKMDLEWEEQELQLKQLHKRIDQLSEEAKKQLRTYWKRRTRKS